MVMAFDEARFGLINWHHRRYCPKGFRPPRVVRRRCEWTYLYITRLWSIGREQTPRL